MTAIERTLGPAFSVTYDATPWIEFFVNAVDSEGQAVVQRLTDWHRGKLIVFMKQAANEGLKDRQADALLFATRLGNLTHERITLRLPARRLSRLPEILQTS